MLAAAHHFFLWLPFYGIIAGYAVALAYDALRRIPGWNNAIGSAVLAGLLIVLCRIMVPGPVSARAMSAATEVRMHNIALATDRIHTSTPSNAVVAVTYFAFNSDVFYSWTHSLDVPEPPSVFDGRRYVIWWGDRSTLQGQKGYALATSSDLPYMKHTMNQISAGHGSDPYRDSGFQFLRNFGAARTKWTFSHSISQDRRAHLGRAQRCTLQNNASNERLAQTANTDFHRRL